MPDAHGIDTDYDGRGRVVWPRLHLLIRRAGPIGDRQFQIEFPDAGVEAFSFTYREIAVPFLPDGTDSAG